ncbi:hypothetical protein C2I36_10370 [Rhodobacteraceae bacterium WD3A24]|nr:hypothetical protein C2I36_10370 [Rhodobacteraceae bacterium WD3A24]
MRNLTRLLPVILVAAAGGWFADWLGLPLAWLIGAAVVTAVTSLAVAPVRVPGALFRAGQMVVGVAVGLTVTSDIVQRLGPHVWVIPLAAVVSLSIGRMMMPFVARHGRLDRTTAYFSLVPAGIAEMADQAGKQGADVGAVATFHTLRVFLIVMILPPIIMMIEPQVSTAVAGGARGLAAFTQGWTPQLAVALGIGLLAAIGGARIGVPSAYVIGPMVAISALSGSGLLEAQEPVVLLAAAQILLGLTLGARFRRETLARLPRALAFGVPAMLLHAAIMSALALLVAGVMGFDPAALLLGFATGGIAEMVLTAQTVGADSALVTAYQVTRGLMGNLLAGTIHARTVAAEEGEGKQATDGHAEPGPGKGKEIGR